MVGSFFLNSKKQQKESLVSVVADLRHASLPTTKFITETLLLLEVLAECALMLLKLACSMFPIFALKLDVHPMQKVTPRFP